LEEGGGMMMMMGYSTNELWLEITGKTNTTATFVIHSPITNGVYDLFMTTNLSADGPGLNRTNWGWLMTCEPGQTNLTVSNLTSEISFFMLGTTNDTDADGLTDAFERLTSHSDPGEEDHRRRFPARRVGMDVLRAFQRNSGRGLRSGRV